MDEETLLVQLNKKYTALGRQHTLTVAERNDYKKQRDQLMNHIKGKKKQTVLSEGVSKLLLVESFGLTEKDIQDHLKQHKDLNEGKEFLKNL